MVRFGSYRFEEVSNLTKGFVNIFVETPLPDKQVADRQVLGGLGWKVLLEGILKGTSKETLEEKREKLLRFSTYTRYFGEEDKSPIFKARLIDPTIGKRIGFSFEKKYALEVVQVDLANFVEGDFEIDDDEDGIGNGWSKYEEVGSPEYSRSSDAFEGNFSQGIYCFEPTYRGGLISPYKKVLGTKYFMSGAFKGLDNTEGTMKFAIRWYNVNKGFISESVCFEGSPSYPDFVVKKGEYDAPSDAVYWRTYFSFFDVGWVNTLLADDVVTRWKDFPT